MPFVSQAQRAYMHIHHPEIAHEFEKKTPKGKKLPYKVKRKGRRRKPISRAASYYLSLAEQGRPLTRKQLYALSMEGVACDVSPLVSATIKNTKQAVMHPIQYTKDLVSGRLFKRTKSDLSRGYGNQVRRDNDLPPISENNMISVKDIIKHHKTHEDVHRSGYEKFKKSTFPGTKAIAAKHKRLWHHHAGVRTRYEALDRQGKTHVSQRQYERDAQGRFASFSLSLVDNVVLGSQDSKAARKKSLPGSVALAGEPKDRFAKARAAKHQRQVLPRAHYVVPAGNAAEMRDSIMDLKYGFPDIKLVVQLQRYPNPDPEDRRQWVLVNVETDNVSVLHSIDGVAKRSKARALNSRGDMSPLEPTARVKPHQREAMGLNAVFTLPEKRGMKFSRDVKRFARGGVDLQVAVRKILDVPKVVIAVRCSDEHTMQLIKHWAAQEWGAHEVGTATFNQGHEIKGD